MGNPGRTRVNPFRAAQFAAAARRLEAEREAAATTVERLLGETARDQWPFLSDHPALQTCGALERLADLMAHALRHDAAQALALAELAVSVAESIPDTAYPPIILAQLRTHAWKDRGKALRNLNRHDDSHQALKRAEVATEPFLVLAHDRATVHYHLALTLAELDRPQESFALLRESKSVFAAHCDTRLLVLCGIAEGVLFQRLQRYREAREAYLLVLSTTDPTDAETLASLHKQIAVCSIELEDFAEAALNLARSLDLYRQLGQPIEVLKVQVLAGRLAIRRGDPEEGIATLRPIRRTFLRQGKPEEAGLCALEIIEGLLLRGQKSGAEKLARMVVNEFTVAGLNPAAIAALQHLTEAIAGGSGTVEMVKTVRESVASLGSDRSGSG